LGHPLVHATGREIGDEGTQDTGTIDFEAYMRIGVHARIQSGLSFQNLSILGDKYIGAFNIKAQKVCCGADAQELD